MHRTILVPVDGSTFGKRALPILLVRPAEQADPVSG